MSNQVAGISAIQYAHYGIKDNVTGAVTGIVDVNNGSTISDGASGTLMGNMDMVDGWIPEIPDNPRGVLVGNGRNILTVQGKVVDPITGSGSLALFDQRIVENISNAKVRTYGGAKAIDYIPDIVQNDICTVINTLAINQDTAGTVGVNEYWVVESHLVNASAKIPGITGANYDPAVTAFSLTYNKTNRDMFGDDVSASDYSDAGAVTGGLTMITMYQSPYPIIYQTWIGDGSRTEFDIDSSITPAGVTANFVMTAAGGTPLTYTGSTATSGEYEVTEDSGTYTITTGDAVADGAYVVARIQYLP